MRTPGAWSWWAPARSAGPAALTSGLLTALLANLGVALLVAIGLTVGGLPGVDSLGFGLGSGGRRLRIRGDHGRGGPARREQAHGHRPRDQRDRAGLPAAGGGRRGVVGQLGSPALSWLSPIGWTQQMRPYGPLHWWVLVIPALVTIAVTAVAYAIAGRRDLGTGLLPVRPGPAGAGASLRDSLGLAWHLQRGTLLAWAAGFAVYGLVIGALRPGSVHTGRQQRGRQEAVRQDRRPDRPGQRVPRRHMALHGGARLRLCGAGRAAPAGRGIGPAGRAGARRRRGPDHVGGEPSGVRGASAR